MKKLLLALCLLMLSIPCHAGDFIELQNSIIDQDTGLIWQRNYAQNLTWQQATNYCAALRLDGYTEWRLPTRAEAVSIMDFDAFNPAATIPLNFATTEPEAYWSFWCSTEQAGDASRAWSANYFTAGIHHNPKSVAKYHARCVTGTSNVGTVLIEKQGGVAIDKKNKLTWQQAPYMGIVTQAGAAVYCSRLNLNGRGWRLPTIAELVTIIDDTRNPATMYPLRDNYAQTWTSSAFPDYCDMCGYCILDRVYVVTSSGCIGIEKRIQTYWELIDNAPNYHTYTRCVRDGISSNPVLWNHTNRW